MLPTEELLEIANATRLKLWPTSVMLKGCNNSHKKKMPLAMQELNRYNRFIRPAGSHLRRAWFLWASSVHPLCSETRRQPLVSEGSTSKDQAHNLWQAMCKHDVIENATKCHSLFLLFCFQICRMIRSVRTQGLSHQRTMPLAKAAATVCCNGMQWMLT